MESFETLRKTAIELTIQAYSVGITCGESFFELAEHMYHFLAHDIVSSNMPEISSDDYKLNLVNKLAQS